ncbi:MAG TPA: hypothetical protein PLQ93_13015 [Bacteroidia bacterium]|nr:hypothetical protein [Bacteroidia bacterium]
MEPANLPRKSIEFDLARLEYDETLNILFFRVKQDIEVDVKEIEEMIRYARELMGDKKHLCVVDFGTSVMSTAEARVRYAESEYIRRYRLADAFLVKSLPIRIVANFFIRVTRPKIKTRLFTSEEEAVDWLLRQNFQTEQ